MYLTRLPSLRPVNIFDGEVTVAVDPSPIISTLVILFGNLNLSKNALALKWALTLGLLLVCLTALIFCVLYEVTIPIVLGKSIPLICICSPVAKEPDVWFKSIVVLLLPAPTAYPLAPLFLPFTKDPLGRSVRLIDWLRTKEVFVWISNNLNSQVVESPVYAESSKLNE